jgi:hypothetical protein
VLPRACGENTWAALAAQFGSQTAALSMLDAWLRLYERGFDFTGEHHYPTLKTLLARTDITQFAHDHPELARRFTVAKEALDRPDD